MKKLLMLLVVLCVCLGCEHAPLPTYHGLSVSRYLPDEYLVMDRRFTSGGFQYKTHLFQDRFDGEEAVIMLVTTSEEGNASRKKLDSKSSYLVHGFAKKISELSEEDRLCMRRYGLQKFCMKNIVLKAKYRGPERMDYWNMLKEENINQPFYARDTTLSIYNSMKIHHYCVGTVKYRKPDFDLLYKTYEILPEGKFRSLRHAAALKKAMKARKWVHHDYYFDEDMKNAINFGAYVNDFTQSKYLTEDSLQRKALKIVNDYLQNPINLDAAKSQITLETFL